MQVPSSLSAALILMATIGSAAFGADPTYYPDKGWRQSSPEAQGLDSAALASLVGGIAAKHNNVHSISIIRHGYLVLDAYFYPYKPDAPHDAGSLTKSITAAITGIAVDEGLVKTDAKLLSFFPSEGPRDADATKQKITVTDLLTMQPGLDCGFAAGERELEEMRHTPDWIGYALALPMKYEPGTKFGYCSPGFHLLSGIVTAATHKPLLEYGRARLFTPLGITNVLWPPDDQGRTHGWGDSHLYPLDFARIAYLYLHGGMWKGKQIISPEWIRKSTTKQSDPGRGPDGGYGYGWWLAKAGNLDEFGGNGRGGQRIAVWAAKDMIVIVTGGGYPADAVMPGVTAAIQSDSPLPANETGLRSLRTSIAEAAKTPAAVPASPLPVSAKNISGAYYEFPRNASRLDGLGLTFNRDNEALLKLRYLGTDLEMPAGLDGVYRLGPYGPLKLPAGATGRWTSENDFLLDVNFIANINHYTLALHFNGDSVDVTANESSGLIRNGHFTGAKTGAPK